MVCDRKVVVEKKVVVWGNGYGSGHSCWSNGGAVRCCSFQDVTSAVLAGVHFQSLLGTYLLPYPLSDLMCNPP